MKLVKTRTVSHVAATRSGRAAAGRAHRAQALQDMRRVEFVMDLVALATGIAAADIRCGTRSHARAARARQVSMYLSYVAWQWPLSRIGAAFARDRTTAGYACRLVEEMRDEPGFDAMLERLEACLRAAPEPDAVRLLAPDLSEMPVIEIAGA